MTNEKQTRIQEEIIEKVVKHFKPNTSTRGYLDLAMRTGKTRITIEWLKREHDYDACILIAYPDNKLKTTWIEELEKWGYRSPNITFTNFSSLKKYVDKTGFDIFICDEFHSLSENEAFLADSIEATKYLYLSGTVNSETKEKWPDFKEIAKYSTLDGIDDGILANYQITIHLVSLDDTIKTPNKKGKLLTEKKKYDNYTYVIEQMKRDGRNFMHLALARNRLSLSSIGKINYTKSLLSKMQDKRVLVFTGLANVADQFVTSYHSKSSDDSHYQAFMEKNINHLALAAMGKMGVTYPNLDSVILLNFTYNAAETAQILNRAIKLDYKNKVADLHIVVLNEPAELKKVDESLSMLDKSKIKYV